MVQIRSATRNDISVLLPLVAAYWEYERLDGFERKSVSSALKCLLTTPSLGAGWIASEADMAVGYLLGVYVFSLEHRGITAEIDELFVLPGNRRSGVGAEILRVAEAEFWRIGCTNVSLQLSRSNDGARDFYRRCGYKERSKYQLLEKDSPVAA